MKVFGLILNIFYVCMLAGGRDGPWCGKSESIFDLEKLLIIFNAFKAFLRIYRFKIFITAKFILNFWHREFSKIQNWLVHYNCNSPQFYAKSL